MRVEIDIQDGIPSTLALEAVRKVINEGKVSVGENGKMHYCWITIFDTNEGEIVVNTRQYRKNDCFLVYKRNK